MTTSDAPPSSSSSPPLPQRIWIVGNDGAGKKSVVAALGATAKKRLADETASPFGEYVWNGVGGGSAGPRVTIAVCADASRWRGECARRDVVVLVFNVTDRASFEAIANDWAPLVSAQTRTLLVGTRLDRAQERVVASSEAMELALVECDDFVEVCATRPPFDGVVYARQLLAMWLSHDESTATTSRAPLSSPSSKQRAGVRSSVWLYDPTEELEVAGRDDVKLRPISRALFEMREASSDRLKIHERRRDHVVANNVGRSRYHGPTESSRSMRWQNHQLQQQQQNARFSQRRQSAVDIDFRHEHATLENKSFLQPTKLMQQRVDEIRHKLLATTPEKPARRLVKRTTESARQRAMSSVPPPPAPGAKSPTRLRAPSLSLSPSKPVSSRYASQRSPSTNIAADNEVVLDLLSSPLAPLTKAAPASPPRSPPMKLKDKDEEPNNHDWSSPENENQCAISTSDALKNPDDCSQERSDATDDQPPSVSSEIDDLLDYFDGVTLPL